ncbi:aggrephagy [Tritrichomonas musculus]|uniref:Aggrephagy n=1 Tax=Tritrichomonas musculus TaxID=1915356 RepID=A0ABR2HGU3_9EUKA
MNENQYFTDYIYNWLKTSLENNDFYELLPIFEGKEKELQNKKKDFGKIFSTIRNPPQNITENKSKKSISSQLLEFIQFLFNNNYHNFIFCYFVRFLPRDQMTYFLSKNILISTINETELSFILAKLPVCDYVVLLHCQRLQYKSTFLISIAFLFNCIDKQPKYIEDIVSKSFRQALQKRIGSNLLHEMLSFLFATESGPKPFDLFFTAFHDSHSILLEYTQSIDLESLFQSFPQREDLPISFLAFLVKTMTVYYFPENLIIQYTIQCSELFFRYVSQITDQFELVRIWRLLLTSIEFVSSFSAASFAFSNRGKNDLIKSGWNSILNMTNSMRIHVVHNILHVYLYFIERYKSLLVLCDERTFKTWTLTFLSLNIDKTCNSNHYLAVVLNIFLIARVNENISSFISDNLCLSEYFLRVLTKSCDDKFNFYTKIIEVLLFILFPDEKYIFTEISPQISNFILITFTSPPCNSFCKQIASSILAILFDMESNKSALDPIKSEISLRIFDNVIDFLMKMSKRIEFQKVCSILFENEKFLMKVTNLCLQKKDEEITITNEKYYNFIILCLSYSCNFHVFYYIYSLIQADICKTIHFLKRIVEQTPIVNSYFALTEPLNVKIPMLQTTVIFWFRMMNSQMISLNSEKEDNSEGVNSQILFSRFPTKIISIPISNDNKYTVMFNRETFYVIEEKTKKVVGKARNVVNIENWNLITINIDNKSIDITLNMQQVVIKFNSSVPNIDSMLIHPCLDIQLLKIYQKNLKWSQILHIFAIGPNSKDNLIDNFMSIAKNGPTIVNPTTFNSMMINNHLYSNRGYISTLYIDFIELFDNDNDKYLNSFSATTHYSISPPYEIIKSGREKIEIDKKNVWSFNTLFNSLDCIGGLNLIIHLFAEVLLKYQKYQDEMLSLISLLLNRFPFVHDFFVENSIYDLFSCLVDSHLNFQSLFLYDNKYITNSKIIQCFLSNDRPSKLIIQNLVHSFHSSSGNHNNKFLNTTQLFNLIIMKLNDFNEDDEVDVLCRFALKLTVHNNFFEHSTFVFTCLLNNHLCYETFINEKFIARTNCSEKFKTTNDNNIIHLLKLFQCLLPNPNIHLEALIPVLLNDDLNDDIKLEILDLLVNNTTMNYYEYLSFALQNMKCDVKKMFDYAINSSPSIATLLFPFFMVRAATKSDNNESSLSNERLENLCSRYSSLLNKFSIDMFNQLFLLLQCPYSSNFFLASKEKNTTSLLMYVVVFIVKSIDNNHTDENTFKLIINFFYLLQNLKFENDQELNGSNEESISVSMTFSLLGTLFFILRSSDYPINNDMILFGLCFGEFLLSQISILSQYANFFIKEILKFIMKISNNISSHDYQSVINQSSKFISFLTSKQTFIFSEKMNGLILLVDEFSKKKRRSSLMNIFFSGHSNSNAEPSPKQAQEIRPFIFQRNKYHVKSSIQALPSAIPHASIKASKSLLNSIDYFEFKKHIDSNDNDNDSDSDNDINSWNWSDFIECCLLYYRSLKSEFIGKNFQEEESFDKIFETWRNVFYSLQNPSSHIYDSCPIKYTISDSSNKIEIRRLLFPMNPSFDNCFLDYWETKYQKEEPKIRLTMKEIQKPFMFSHPHKKKNDRIFKAFCLYRISMIKGFILVTDQRIKFYKKDADDVMAAFLYKNVKYIRQMFHQHEKKGILIEDDCFRNYSFAFKKESDCEDFLNLVSHRTKIFRSFETDKLLEKQKKWVSNEISNFDYLIYLNKFSGRTWCDFTQYPFFPWVLSKYESYKPKKSKQKNTKTEQQNKTDNEILQNDTENKKQQNDNETEIQQNNTENEILQNDNETEIQQNDANDKTDKNSIKEQLQLNGVNITYSDEQRDNRTKLNLHDTSIYRDLNYQLFAQTEAHRKCCNDYYDVTYEMNDQGSHFPNYVSNVGSAIYYLVRLEPFITEEILFQGGKYDSPDRMFQSFDITSKIMFGINTKSSLEFVPEVYYLPEMYKNVNNLVFPRSILDSTIDLERFTLPSWSKSPEDLVYKMRKALESPYVSTFLHEWINLIWGVKRTGDLALKSTNVFPELVFKFNKEMYKGDKVMIRGMMSELHNCGTAPEQLFHELHPQRNVPVLSDNYRETTSSSRNVSVSSARSMSSLSSIRNESSTPNQRTITHYTSNFSPQNARKNSSDRLSRKISFDVNARFLFFEQRESRLLFAGIRSPMAKELYSLKFDRDWLIIPPIHKIRINRKGGVEVVRRNSICPAQKFRFSRDIRPIFISKSGSDIVTAHQTPIIAHWRLSTTSNSSSSVSSSSSSPLKMRNESPTRSQMKVPASSSSSSILSNLNSNSNFNLNLSATSSSSLSSTTSKRSSANNSGTVTATPTQSSVVSASPINSNQKTVTFENDSYNLGESCLMLESVLRGYSVNITSVFISTTSFIILAGHEDGCVSLFSISPHQFIRVIQITNDQKRLKYPVTMIRTANWNSDIIIFQEKLVGQIDTEIEITPTCPTDVIQQSSKKSDTDNSSMMNKFVTSVKNKFHKGNDMNKREVKSTNQNSNQNKSEVVTFVSLYSVNGVFHKSVCLNHRIKECCGTCYPYATKKNYFALLSEDDCIILLNGRNLRVVQVYDISSCPQTESMIYNKMNDSLILTTKTREIIDFNMIPASLIND